VKIFARTLLSFGLFAQSVQAQPTTTPPAPPGGVVAPVPVVETPAPQPAAPAVPPAVEALPGPAVTAEPAPAQAAVPLVTPAPAPPAAAVPAPSVPEAEPVPGPPLQPPAPFLAAPVPAEAPAPPRRHGDAGAAFAIGAGGGFVWYDDPGYRRAGNERRRTMDVLVSYDVLQPSRNLVIAAGASLRRSVTDGDLLELADHTLQAELLARLQASSVLVPHLRASLGAEWTRAKLQDAGQGGAIEDRDVALASSFGVGLTLKTPSRAFEGHNGRAASLSFGVLVEGGYTLAKAASFAGTPSGGSDDVERSSVRLGSLPRSAPYLRILGVVRF
jgi:hypothetical protein